MKKINDIASLYNLYVDHLYTYALYWGFDKETIMDAIHDVFCKLAADQKKLYDVSNIKLYLFRALKNRLYDIFKTRREYVGLSIIESQEMPFDIQITIEDPQNKGIELEFNSVNIKTNDFKWSTQFNLTHY